MSTNDLGTAGQTGAALQYVADQRDISAPAADRRRITDPAIAAELLRDELLDRLNAVFRDHPGDPVILLSGGVDSIAVAAAARQLGHRPRAITVVTDDSSTDATNSAQAAAALDLEHDLLVLDGQAVTDLAHDAVSRLGTPELWEVSYAVPLLAVARALDQRTGVGAILTGSAADAILAGGKTLDNPIDSAAATAEVDRIIRKESGGNFRYQRLIPDFYARVLPQYESRFVLVFQTLRFWELAEQFAPPALFGEHDGIPADKLCLRLLCEQLLPAGTGHLAWTKKDAIQRSAGIMGALATAARRYAAQLPGAQTYTDPMTEPMDAVATRLFLANLARESE